MKTFRSILFTSMLHAQSTIWQKSLGGNDTDEGRMVRETKDYDGKDKNTGKDFKVTKSVILQ